jgi:cyanophycinase
VAAVGKEDVLGLTKARGFINTKTFPEPLLSIGDGHGTIIPAGGSTSDVEEFYKAIHEATGEERPRIAILNSSRDSVDIAYDHFHLDDPPYLSLFDQFTDFGFEPVYIPLAIDTYEDVADDPYFSALIKSSHAVMLQGGDQAKHARSLVQDDGSDTELLKAIREVYQKGGVIAGTSAGAHVMSHPMFAAGTSHTSLVINHTEAKNITDVPLTGFLNPTIAGNNFSMPGIGLLDGILTDTHFDERGRFGRLLVGIRDTGASLGLGLDEGTALAIKDNVGTVVGLNGVFLVDASLAEFNEKGAEKGFEAKGLVVHYLTEGDQYDFLTGTVIPADFKKEANFNDALIKYDSIFAGRYETTKAILDFALSNRRDTVWTSSNDSPIKSIVKVYAFKEDETRVWVSNINYSVRPLSDRKKATVSGIKLNVMVD